MAVNFNTPARIQGIGSTSTFKIEVTFSYNCESPLTFGMKFNSGRFNDEVFWIASLDLLREGLSGPAGLADVQIWPEMAKKGDDHKLVIRLGNETRDSKTWIPMQVAVDFINAIDEEERMSIVSSDEAIEMAVDDFLVELGLAPLAGVGYGTPNPGGPSQPQGWCYNCGRVHSGNGCGDF